MEAEAAEQVLRDRLAGATLRQLSTTTGLSIEGVRIVCSRASRRLVDNMELAIMVGAKAEQIGQEAIWPTFLVPFQAQEDWQTALAFFSHCLAELRSRGVNVAVRTRPTKAGTAFQITGESP